MENMEIKKTILITGGTGFLGSHIVNKLSDKYKIIILKRSFSNTWRIEDNKNIFYYNIDRINLEKVFDENEIDIVIHTATSYGRNNESVSEITKTNLMFPLKLLELSLKNKVEMFINTDTVSPKYLNEYSLSKSQLTEWLKFYSTQIKIFNLKLEHMYGEKDSTTKFVTYIIYSFLKNIPEINLTKGEQKRDFIYIKDVVDAYYKVLKNYEKFDRGFYEYEIGSGNSITIKELVLKIKGLIENTKTKLNFGAIEYRKNEIMESKSDITKFKKDFNWYPGYSLDEGLKRTIEWYKNNMEVYNESFKRFL